VTVRNTKAVARSAASQTTSRSTRTRWPWIVASVAVVGAAAGVVALLTATRNGHIQPAPAASAISQETTAAGAGHTQAAKPTRSSVTVVTQPPGAVVRIDGAARGAAPLTIPVELGRRMLIEAEVEGFEPVKQSIAAEREAQTVMLSLVARPIPKPAEVRSLARPTRGKQQPSGRDSGSSDRNGSRGSFDRNDVSGD
jgi:hypothetical protein